MRPSTLTTEYKQPKHSAEQQALFDHCTSPSTRWLSAVFIAANYPPTGNTVTNLEQALAARFTDADEIKDVANYGCAAGVSGFIYNKEIRDFFNEHEDDIENTIADLGYDIKDLADAETNSVMELINKMVWFVVEDYCQRQVLEAEAEHHYALT